MDIRQLDIEQLFANLLNSMSTPFVPVEMFVSVELVPEQKGSSQTIINFPTFS